MADFTFTKRGDLRIKLEKGDREKIAEMRGRWDDESVFLELIERQLCNGWDNVYRIACWGNNINLTQEHETDDHGDTISLGKVYTYTDYAIRSEVDVLLEDGSIIFTMFE